jgi:hypothetical protein
MLLEGCMLSQTINLGFEDEISSKASCIDLAFDNIGVS